ncbi:membrane protein insertase YidC [Ramlibacter sp. PS4R-6]|uniref:membrane protein insertase YidC n=1 Tax=Ramlibacter sp. PS4R-6 TaxID=3133438 RepID=UPI003095360D
MTDIRRTILWVIFGFSMVLLWDQWQVFNGHPATFFPQPAKPSASAPARAGSSSVPSASSATPAPAGATASTVPGAPPTAPAAAQAEKIVVTTDTMVLTFSTEGGSLVRTEFLKERSDDRKSNFVLLNEEAGHVYVAESGLIGGDFPNHKTVMAFSGDKQLKDGQDAMTVRFESPEKGGLKLVKTYTLKRGSYEVQVKHEVINTGAQSVTPQLYLQIVRDTSKLSSGSSFYSTFTGPAVYTGEKHFQKVELADIDKNKADFQKESTSGYVAMVQHYFASAWILPQGTKREVFVRKLPETSSYAVGMIAPLPPVAAGGKQAVDARFFAGPEDERELEKIEPGLELVKDYGVFTIIAKPLYWLLAKLHGFLGNWGWSIMALVLLIKIAFYWLQAKGYESMAKMKAINPKVMAIRDRYKDEPQKMQTEMMRIYKEEKVNPMGGCFPILIQIPVFIALYWVLLSSVEMRGAPWILWIKDLAEPDPWFILPVVMTISTLIQTALNPAPPDPVQAKMMWFMPLAFSVMFFFFPSGLVLYWVTNNILSIAQQALINHRMGVPVQFNLPKFS